MNQHFTINLKQVLAALLTLAALFAGQNAWAATVTLSEDPDIPVGTAGHWYVNMLRYTDQSLTLTEADITTGGKSTFKVYDDGGKNGNYTSSCKSKLYITVPNGYLIQVSGTVWTKNNPLIEYLELYNANGVFNSLTTVYSDADGQAKDFGPLVTQKVTSNINVECTDGQYLTVYFRVTTDETTYRGFDMTVTVFPNIPYNVNIAEDIEHGSVNASPNQAYYNDEVTLTATPNANYYIGTVSYNDGTSDHVIAPNNNGDYKFTMPQHDVTVNATFLDEVGHFWGEGNDGTASHPYVISDLDGWDLLVTKSADQTYTNGKYFELANDISGVSNSVKYFGGHLDGKGHKITLDMDLTGYGLIQYIPSTSSISNLTVDGSMMNDVFRSAGGFVAEIGYDAVTFTNCRCSVAIQSIFSNLNNSFNGGGFVGSTLTEGNVFDRCVFDGSFSSKINNVSFFPWIGGNAACTVTNSAYLYLSNGSTEASAYKLTLSEHAAVERTGGTAIGNSSVTFYADGFTLDSDEYYTSGTTVIINVPGINITAATYNGNAATINPDGTASFTMPAANTTATATSFAANYIDADGTEQTHAVSLLSSSDEAVICEGGWYAVTGNVTLNDGLSFSGEAHLILTDGATLTVDKGGTSETNIAIAATDFSVYGQTLGTGTLNANSRNHKSAFNNKFQYAYSFQVTGNITVCGGYVNATATGINNDSYGGVQCYAIHAVGSVTVIRGHVSAIANADHTNGHLYDIVAASLILDWRLPTDRIIVTLGSKNLNTTVSVAEGKALWNGTEVLSGTISSSGLDSAINNKTLQPCIIRNVSGYGTGNGGWAFIASPVTGSIAPTTVSGLVATTATEYDLYRFNQSANKQWENYKIHDFDIENGKGYLYATKNTQTLVFMGDALNMGTSVEVPLVYDGDAEFAGWNLVGNPFTENATLDRSYYVMNAEGTGIEATAVDGATPIAPCTGVLVQATGTNQSVTFTKVTTQQNASNNPSGLQIALTQANTRDNALLDNAIVSFNEGSQLGKFYFGEQNANIYIPQNGKEYAIAYSDGHGEMPVNFKAKKNGEYTLTISATFHSPVSTLHLIDNLTGADIDLLTTPSYTFTAKNDDYASRFKLVFNASTGSASESEDFAFISNGNLIVNGEGTIQVFDVTGRVLVNGDARRQISTAGFVPGVYMLQLINGEHVRTQKIVVE